MQLIIHFYKGLLWELFVKLCCSLPIFSPSVSSSRLLLRSQGLCHPFIARQMHPSVEIPLPVEESPGELQGCPVCPGAAATRWPSRMSSCLCNFSGGIH